MKQIKLHYENRHLFIEDNHDLFVYDTGSPISFGLRDYSPLNNRNRLKPNAPGLDVEMLSDYIGVPVIGLIGTDILNQYDHIINLKTNTLTFSENQLKSQGNVQKLTRNSQTGIPTLEARVDDNFHTYIFDTGAQFSYHIAKIPEEHIECIEIEDFWGPIGKFKTQSYHAKVGLTGFERWMHLGVPPKELVGTLKQTFNVKGILGNELMRNRITGYFPRRRELILQE
jgi:hypothetical protein